MLTRSDPNSNATASYDPVNELNQYAEVDSVSFGYDNNGCMLTDGVWDFAYDTESRLISATDGTTSAAYLYDPLNRQVQKEVNSTKKRFIYSGWQRIADYDGANNLEVRYVFGAGLDEPLIAVTSAGTLSFMHPDRLGSVVALSDNSGTVTNVYQYNPWGESPDMSGTTFGFTGQRFDSETGLYYYKNRYYSTKLGRFLQPDPMLYIDGLNLYQYAQNNPLSFVDPLGFASDSASSGCSCGCSTGGGSSVGADSGAGSMSAASISTPGSGNPTILDPLLTNLLSQISAAHLALQKMCAGILQQLQGPDQDSGTGDPDSEWEKCRKKCAEMTLLWEYCMTRCLQSGGTWPPDKDKAHHVTCRVDDYYAWWLDGSIHYVGGRTEPLIEICIDGQCISN